MRADAVPLRTGEMNQDATGTLTLNMTFLRNQDDILLISQSLISSFWLPSFIGCVSRRLRIFISNQYLIRFIAFMYQYSLYELIKVILFRDVDLLNLAEHT